MDKGCRKRSKTIEILLNATRDGGLYVRSAKTAGYEDDQSGDVGEGGVDTEIHTYRY